MCGIIGVISSQSVSEKLIEALKMLEYRGYDSAGLATIDLKGEISIRKSIGKVANLEKFIKKQSINGVMGIAHTRWATHGEPKIENTHPMATASTVVVHNGIIDNYQQIKEDLINHGYEFQGDTDTEVIPNLIDFFQDHGNNFFESILLTVKQLKGSFALAIMSKSNPDIIIGVKLGSPLLVGINNEGDEGYLASDSRAISKYCQKVAYLKDEQIVILENNKYSVLDFNGMEQFISEESVKYSDDTNLNKFSTYMLKEINEQPAIVEKIFKKHRDIQITLQKKQNITIIACGTSLYAGHVIKYLIENHSNIKVQIEIASEFAHRTNIYTHPTDLFIFISQSGETADTLAALRRVKNQNGKTLGLVNTPNSSIAKLVDDCLLIEAGLEIAVAATKTFLAQIASLMMLFSSLWQNIDIQYSERHILSQMKKAIKCSEIVQDIVKQALLSAKNILLVGRGISYPLALEGALKLKELSYIAAEGIAAGELKHGSIALIDAGTPVIAIVPEDSYLVKMLSSLNEIKARKGKIILIASRDVIAQAKGLYSYAIEVPAIYSEFDIPFIYAPILQLIAHHTALLKGNDVDQPRNLAKSVTVE